jgi:hypothetical protein
LGVGLLVADRNTAVGVQLVAVRFVSVRVMGGTLADGFVELTW